MRYAIVRELLSTLHEKSPVCQDVSFDSLLAQCTGGRYHGVRNRGRNIVLVQPVKTGITPPLAIPSCGQEGEKGLLRRAERLHERQ